MTAFVISILVVGAVIAAAVGVAMWFDVALGAGADALGRRESESLRWRPPFVQGRELFEWARSVAFATVDEVLLGPRSADLPRRLTVAVEAGLERAMVPAPATTAHAGPVPCPEVGQGVVAVTAPEAIVAADYLRERLSDRDLTRLRSESADNVGWIQRISSVYGSDAPCSLQGTDCVCAAWPVRPLQCRAVHAVSSARRRGGRDPWLEAGALTHAEQVCEGALVGVREGLRGAGLDDGLYEMHSALVRALEIPDAAERWGRGEKLFAGCLPSTVEPPPHDSGLALH